MFYLIDKPLGISSFDVIRRLRKILNTRKMGHTGTLDPLASGCLLIATDDSTKLIPLLEGREKRYSFTVTLDGISDSLDQGTPVHSIDTSDLHIPSEEQIVTFLSELKSQIPPVYSALHISGKRAYERALAGENFIIPERAINIKNVTIDNISEKSIDITLTISSGGYIRSLAPALGRLCGVAGGYISKLERIAIILENGAHLEKNECSLLDNPVPIDYMKLFPTFHTIDISSEEYIHLTHGKEIPLNYPDGKYFTRYNSFLSIGTILSKVYKIQKNRV